jgi:hypothetical protein
MKKTRAAALAFAILVPTPLLAQVTIPSDTPLADVVLTVYATEIVDNINAGADPVSAASDLADAFIITQALTSQLSTFPLGSSAGGFTWTFMPGTGTFSRTTESFGPIFAERALTIGKGRMNVGVNYQWTSFDSFEGRGLENREIAFSTPSASAPGSAVRSRCGAAARRRPARLSARAKYRVFDLEGGGVAAGVDIRLPTGDEENLLGIPGTQAKFSGVLSMTSGRLSPHVNVGYTVSSGNDLVDDPDSVFLEPPDELDYTFGADVVVTPRFTIPGDIVGRALYDVPRLEFTDVGLGPPFMEFSFAGASTLNTLLASAGLKYNVSGNLPVSGNVLFPLTDGGLRSKITPVAGVDYSS